MTSYHYRVIIVGHAISPLRGSEPGFTWNWAWHLSRHLPVDVVAFPQYRQEVEAFLAEHPNPHLRLHWVALRGWDPWNPRKGERGIRLHYLLWLREASRAVEGLVAKGRVPSVVHHVSWGAVSAPPPPLRTAPLVWGPVGGGQVAPAAFRGYFGGWWPKEILRSYRLKLLPFIPGWRRAIRSFPIVLATNRETEALLIRAGAKEVRLFLDTGVPQNFGLSHPPRAPRPEVSLRLLWAGRFEARKALPLALRALAQVRVPVELWVAGDGLLAREWREEAQRLGLGERVRFLGRLPWSEMKEIFEKAHAFLFTSLRDSFGSVVLEAMAYGLPVVALDHQGVGTFLPPEAAIKVPVREPRDTIGGLAEAIERLAEDEGLRLSMSQAAWRFAQEERWDRRAERMLSLYEEVLDAHRHL